MYYAMARPNGTIFISIGYIPKGKHINLFSGEYLDDVKATIEKWAVKSDSAPWSYVVPGVSDSLPEEDNLKVIRYFASFIVQNKVHINKPKMNNKNLFNDLAECFESETGEIDKDGAKKSIDSSNLPNSLKITLRNSLHVTKTSLERISEELFGDSVDQFDEVFQVNRGCDFIDYVSTVTHSGDNKSFVGNSGFSEANARKAAYLRAAAQYYEEKK